MELLAEQGPLSATAIARVLGIHQSSASRLLGVLLNAGFVRKPSYHAFALDYGALVFAGGSMGCFPAITASAEVCNRIARDTGLNATVGMLWRDRLLYLTRANTDSSIVLVNNCDFPIHASSIGLYLAWEQGSEQALRLIRESLADNGEEASRGENILASTEQSIRTHGILYLSDRGPGGCNASLTFDLDDQRMALAVFSHELRANPECLRPILQKGIGSLRRIMDTRRFTENMATYR